MFPSEIESVLRTHENVAEASVFSIKNDQGLDLCGCAWIILKDKKKKTTIEEIQAMCGKKVLENVKFVDDYPLNSNGKINKLEMASIFKTELEL